MKTHILKIIVAALLDIVFTMQLHAQSTAFTYQGLLAENGDPVSGLYDLSFELFDAGTDGFSQGALTNMATQISNGLFTVVLDFGDNVFNAGDDRWLEIGAATNGGGAFATLSPRQPITEVVRVF